jgi:endonuclease/exonuclease/phosphatase family metal-dependent hydrolase
MPARRLEWAVAGGFAGWALARLVAADRLRPTAAQSVVLLPFTPQVAAGAWVASLALRDRRARYVAALAAGALTTAVAPRAIPHRQAEVSGQIMRVLTANLLGGRAEAEPVVELVRQTKPDVLFVQELTLAATGRLHQDGLDEIMPHSVTDLGRPRGRGNGIFSRYPLQECLPATTPVWAQPTANVTLPAGVARLVCVHLQSPRPPWYRPEMADWESELRALRSITVGGDPPLVMAGDFNATFDQAVFRELVRCGYADAAREAGNGLLPTWGPRPGGRRALLTIDHVLTDPRCAVLGTSVHPLPGTDHRGLLATIRLPAAS